MNGLRKWRLRRYEYSLRRYPLAPIHHRTTLPHLITIWSKVNVEDLAGLDREYRYRRLRTHSTCLEELLQQVVQYNELITKEKDFQLEANLQNRDHPTIKHLDHYLTDMEGCPVDIQPLLEELQVLLNIHHVLVRCDEGDFYRRMSVPLYHDLVELTTALLSS